MKLLAILLTATIGLAMNEKTVILAHENFPTAMSGKDRVIPLKPTPEQIEILESKLDTYLAKHNPVLAKKYKSYFRQYSGVQVGQIKKIRANFLCRVHDERWKKEWISVDDGGDCYFEFTFDVDRSEILDFSVNGNS